MTDLWSQTRADAEEISPTPDQPVGSTRREESADLGPQSEEGRGCRRPRVVILTNIPAPYRVHQFAQLAESGRYDYLIYFCASSEPNRQWRRSESYGFRHEILNARAHTFLGGYSYFIPSFFVRLLREKPRAVIVGGFSLQLLLARLYGRLRGAGVIVMNDSNILYEQDLPTWRTALRRLLVRGIDGAIGCSRLGTDYLRWLGVPSHRIALSRCVNDVVSFSERARAFRAVRAEERRRHGLPGEAVVLLYVGRPECRKGDVELLEAFAAVRAGGRGAPGAPPGTGPQPGSGQARVYTFAGIVRTEGLSSPRFVECSRNRLTQVEPQREPVPCRIIPLRERQDVLRQLAFEAVHLEPGNPDLASLGALGAVLVGEKMAGDWAFGGGTVFKPNPDPLAGETGTASVTVIVK